MGQESPTGIYTVEATSRIGSFSAPREVDRLADYYGRYGVEDAAVIGLPEGQLGVTAQIRSTSVEDARVTFLRAASWLDWEEINIYEGVPD